MSNTYGHEEIESYDFGDAEAPAGFDNEGKGYIDPPDGEHVFRIDSFSIAEANEFKYNRGEGLWVGNQLRPTIMVASGEHRDARCIDFIPLPTAGAEQMPAPIANRWSNFLRSLGFKIPENKVVPAGFKLHDIIGKTCRATIVNETYEDKTRPKVKFMSYAPVSHEDSKPSGMKKKPASSTTPAAKPKVQEAETFDPDDI